MHVLRKRWGQTHSLQHTSHSQYLRVVATVSVPSIHRIRYITNCKETGQNGERKQLPINLSHSRLVSSQRSVYTSRTSVSKFNYFPLSSRFPRRRRSRGQSKEHYCYFCPRAAPPFISRVGINQVMLFLISLTLNVTRMLHQRVFPHTSTLGVLTLPSSELMMMMMAVPDVSHGVRRGG